MALYMTISRVALHTVTLSRYQYAQVYMGPNPYGPKGGRCGNVVDARLIYQATRQAAWVNKACEALRAYCAARNILELGEPPQEHLDDIEKVAKRRGISKEECISHVLRTYLKVEDLPLLINDVPEVKFILESTI